MIHPGIEPAAQQSRLVVSAGTFQLDLVDDARHFPMAPFKPAQQIARHLLRVSRRRIGSEEWEIIEGDRDLAEVCRSATERS